MTTCRRAFLRDLMAFAWSSFRADPSRSFANCLAGAWHWFKNAAARAASHAAFMRRHNGGAVALRSMLQSPIRRSLRGPHGETRARELGYVTSVMGR